MKWFDKKELKNEGALPPDQVGFIRSNSFSIFGPLNIIIRKQWDLFFTVILAQTLNKIASAIPSDTTAMLIWLLGTGIYIYLIIFAYKNSRRLAWNRNNWKSFEEFKASEDKWRPWGIIFFVIMILSLLYETEYLFIGAF